MAAVVTIRNLYACLGFSAGATTVITDDQGIDNLDKLNLLHDHDCGNLCKSICCPGVTIVSQGRVDIPNPGISVLLWDDMNLTLTTYYLRNLNKISRTIGAANLSLPMVRPVIILKEHQEYHEQPATAPKLNKKNMVKP